MAKEVKKVFEKITVECDDPEVFQQVAPAIMMIRGQMEQTEQRVQQLQAQMQRMQEVFALPAMQKKLKELGYAK